MKSIQLRDTVKDDITGFQGIVIAITEYLNGSISYQVQPTTLTRKGDMQESRWIDCQQLEIIFSPSPSGRKYLLYYKNILDCRRRLKAMRE